VVPQEQVAELTAALEGTRAENSQLATLLPLAGLDQALERVLAEVRTRRAAPQAIMH
jgi:hypothetical protein